MRQSCARARACQTPTPGLLRRKRRLHLTKRGPTAINRARETTKRAAVLLPRELLDTPLANGSRRPARLLLLLLLEKSTWSGSCPLPFFHSLFSLGGREGEGWRPFLSPGTSGLFSLSLFILFLFFFARARDGKSTT